jgi:sigma-E factor negative regulatory protein RseB
MARWSAAALALSACLAAAAPAQASETARDLLQRMSQALTTSSYVGEFRLEGRGYTERMRIVHCVRDGAVSERLVSLNGPGRELIRQGDEVTAYLPDKQIAVIERRPGRGALLGTLPRFDGDIEHWYELELAGRLPAVNGRPAAVVEVRPRDGYRFGHRLWIDEETGMPVQTELLDADGRTLERLRFTQLEIREDIPDSSLKPGVDPARFRWVRQAAHEQVGGSAWQVRRPPPGFRVSASSVRDMAGVPSPVSQLVLSDGLASVSVFIHAPAGDEPPPQGPGRAGGSATFTAMVEGQHVTAVGEVPPRTLKAIVDGVARRE